MRLSYLSIRNLRAIESLELRLRDFTSLIGPNNSGKTTVLRAIEILVNQEKPDPSEWRHGHEDENIEIIGHFEDIADWERDTPGVSGLIHDGMIQLRATASRDGDSVTLVYDAYARQVTIEGWSSRWSELGQEIKNAAEALGIGGQQWRTQANQQRVRERIIQEHPDLVELGDADWTDEHISISAALKQALPQAVYIHAVRDASDDAKPTARTSFGLLLKRIILPAIQSSDEYTELIGAVEALSAKIRATGDDQLESISTLASEISARMSSIIEARVVFKLDTPDTDKFLGANTGINIDDGIETPIHLQGHGAQRALVFAMIEVLASQDASMGEDQQRSTILLFEEPEIFLHPHLMRRLRDALVEISGRQDWQVAITTHSPFFVNVADDPTSLIITRRTERAAPVSLCQIDHDPFVNEGEVDERTALRAALDFHPTVAEAFFARQVVLVEGETELSVFKHSQGIHALIGISEEERALTTIVSCGGKWTIPAMARVLHAFAIPFRIIHDTDRKGRDDAELEAVAAIDPYRANERIAAAAAGADVYPVDDTFEDLIWQEPTAGHDKPYRAWCRIKSLIDGEITLEHCPGLQEVFLFAYRWTQ